MSEQNQNSANKPGTTDDNTNNQLPAGTTDDDLTAKIEAAAAEKLKPIKEKLDNAYKQRDEAVARAEKAEAEKRQRDLELLREQGKHEEAYKQELAEEKLRREKAERRNIELTRDLEVKSALSNFEFRNDKAASLAFQEITSNLVQNEQGQWVHRSGVAVRDYVQAFHKDDANGFLFKQKVNSGGGSTQNRSASPVEKPSRLFDLSQDEVLKMAAEGKLPRRQRR